MFKTIEVTYSVKQEDVKSSKIVENSNSSRRYSDDKMTDTARTMIETKKFKSISSKRTGRNDPTLKSKLVEDPLGHKNWQIPSSHIDRDFLLMEFDYKISSRQKNSNDNENNDFQSKVLPDSPTRSPSLKNRKKIMSSKSVLGRERKCSNTAGAVLQIDPNNNSNSNIHLKEWNSS